MADSSAESLLMTTSGLLTYYSYEVGSQSQESLLAHWLKDYSPEWVRLALIESLYRGRYRTISVRGLLADWERRGQPIYHFNREFEALICHNFPRIWFRRDSNLNKDLGSPTVMAMDQDREQPPPSTQPVPPLPSSDADEHSTMPFSQDIEPFATDDSEPPTFLMSEKLWSFVAAPEPNETVSTVISSDAPTSMANIESVPVANSQKVETAPIDQFTPQSEFSELYQKLVSMVSSI